MTTLQILATAQSADENACISVFESLLAVGSVTLSDEEKAAVLPWLVGTLREYVANVDPAWATRTVFLAMQVVKCITRSRTGLAPLYQAEFLADVVRVHALDATAEGSDGAMRDLQTETMRVWLNLCVIDWPAAQALLKASAEFGETVLRVADTTRSDRDVQYPAMRVLMYVCLDEKTTAHLIKNHQLYESLAQIVLTPFEQKQGEVQFFSAAEGAQQRLIVSECFKIILNCHLWDSCPKFGEHLKTNEVFASFCRRWRLILVHGVEIEAADLAAISHAGVQLIDAKQASSSSTDSSTVTSSSSSSASIDEGKTPEHVKPTWPEDEDPAEFDLHKKTVSNVKADALNMLCYMSTDLGPLVLEDMRVFKVLVRKIHRFLVKGESGGDRITTRNLQILFSAATALCEENEVIRRLFKSVIFGAVGFDEGIRRKYVEIEGETEEEKTAREKNEQMMPADMTAETMEAANKWELRWLLHKFITTLHFELKSVVSEFLWLVMEKSSKVCLCTLLHSSWCVCVCVIFSIYVYMVGTVCMCGIRSTFACLASARPSACWSRRAFLGSRDSRAKPLTPRTCCPAKRRSKCALQIDDNAFVSIKSILLVTHYNSSRAPRVRAAAAGWLSAYRCESDGCAAYTPAAATCFYRFEKACRPRETDSPGHSSLAREFSWIHPALRSVAQLSLPPSTRPPPSGVLQSAGP